MKFLNMAFALLLLSLGLALAVESGPQWTVVPWVNGNISNAISASVNASKLDLSSLNISGHEPSAVTIGKEKIPCQEYRSRTRSTELWLLSGSNWTQYMEVHRGDRLELLAYTPLGGNGDLYQIDYANSSISHWEYHLQTGYSNASFRAEKVGRIMFILTVENQPSNALVIDVIPTIETAKGPKNIERFSPGYALVTIALEKVKGFDVYLDGVFYSSDIADGVLDGKATFRVGGDSIHTITISKKESFGIPAYQSEHIRSFQSGYSYQLTI